MAPSRDLSTMQVLREYRSKLVGGECRLFSDRVEVERAAPGTQSDFVTEVVLAGEIREVRVTKWAGLSLANLVIETEGGRSLELRMLPRAQASEACAAIRDVAGLPARRKSSAA
jgi:hypothetical protein